MRFSRAFAGALVAAVAATLVQGAGGAAGPRVQEYPVPPGTHPHDVAPAPDGTVWYTAQAAGKLGRLDLTTGQTTEVPLGEGSAPHGVIVGLRRRVGHRRRAQRDLGSSPARSAFRGFRLPASARNANLNTATFDKRGILWFTGRTASTAG